MRAVWQIRGCHIRLFIDTVSSERCLYACWLFLCHPRHNTFTRAESNRFNQRVQSNVDCFTGSRGHRVIVTLSRFVDLQSIRKIQPHLFRSSIINVMKLCTIIVFRFTARKETQQIATWSKDLGPVGKMVAVLRHMRCWQDCQMEALRGRRLRSRRKGGADKKLHITCVLKV